MYPWEMGMFKVGQQLGDVTPSADSLTVLVYFLVWRMRALAETTKVTSSSHYLCT